MQDLITYSEPTMSSLQIAALTGKLHRNVTSDIERPASHSSEYGRYCIGFIQGYNLFTHW
jgi:phage regulator Rha-like protein